MFGKGNVNGFSCTDMDSKIDLYVIIAFRVYEKTCNLVFRMGFNMTAANFFYPKSDDSGVSDFLKLVGLRSCFFMRS